MLYKYKFICENWKQLFYSEILIYTCLIRNNESVKREKVFLLLFFI